MLAHDIVRHTTVNILIHTPLNLILKFVLDEEGNMKFVSKIVSHGIEHFFKHFKGTALETVLSRCMTPATTDFLLDNSDNIIQFNTDSDNLNHLTILLTCNVLIK